MHTHITLRCDFATHSHTYPSWQDEMSATLPIRRLNVISDVNFGQTSCKTQWLGWKARKFKSRSAIFQPFQDQLQRQREIKEPNFDFCRRFLKFLQRTSPILFSFNHENHRKVSSCFSYLAISWFTTGSFFNTTRFWPYNLFPFRLPTAT